MTHLATYLGDPQHSRRYARTSLVGWRVFSVGDDGALLPPFAVQYWPAAGSASKPWGGTGSSAYWQSLAYCAADGDHAAPNESCTCGLRATEDLAELLTAVTERRFTGSSSSILDECGVIARVRLFGKLLTGVDIPNDDPPTTWRGSQAGVLDVHLAPGMDQHRDAIEARYKVAVKTYDPGEWPHTVAPLPGTGTAIRPYAGTAQPVTTPTVYAAPTPAAYAAFFKAIQPLGFGCKSTDRPEAFLPIAESLIAGMRGGGDPADAAIAMVDSLAHPSWEQALAFIRAAIKHLAPDLRS